MTNEKMPIDEHYNGHNLSIITCGLFTDNYCYYKIPHGGGAIFVTVENVDPHVFDPVDILKFNKILMDCIGNYDLDHKVFVESFLAWNKTPYQWVSSNELVASFDKKLILTFDELYRIKSIKIQ